MLKQELDKSSAIFQCRNVKRRFFEFIPCFNVGIMLNKQFSHVCVVAISSTDKRGSIVLTFCFDVCIMLKEQFSNFFSVIFGSNARRCQIVYNACFYNCIMLNLQLSNFRVICEYSKEEKHFLEFINCFNIGIMLNFSCCKQQWQEVFHYSQPLIRSQHYVEGTVQQFLRCCCKQQ